MAKFEFFGVGLTSVTNPPKGCVVVSMLTVLCDNK